MKWNNGYQRTTFESRKKQKLFAWVSLKCSVDHLSPPGTCIIEIGGCYGMEMNVEKTKVMRFSRQPFPVKFMIDQ